MSEGRRLEYWLERMVRECMSVIDSEKTMVILAGISEEMKHLISSNNELSRRATKFFVFSDHNSAGPDSSSRDEYSSEGQSSLWIQVGPTM
ncbi:hypothetical protein IFM89_017552 [Coptis chinensis]|uniref:Uncharacterized protein n=1 Tax=Coptis chinensis TaxID=261450 RepID=A0A835HY91_9MAGN|nr:hypothetical protein IFM89_017552 [Coptis chinensis]